MLALLLDVLIKKVIRRRKGGTVEGIAETFRSSRFRTNLRPRKTVGSARDKLLCSLVQWLELKAWEWRISLIDDVAAVYWSRQLSQSTHYLL